MTDNSQTKWVVGAFGSLLLLAVTTLAGLDRSRIAGDAREALARAQKAEQAHEVLRTEVVGDVKAIREQLAQIQEQQKELLREMRRRR